MRRNYMPRETSIRAQLLSLAFCLAASPVVAQMAAPAPALADVAPPAPAPAPVGPTIASATAGISNTSNGSTEMTWNNNRRAKDPSGPVLAIVGGAALIGGLLIGGGAGTAIAVGGLIMGLIGLYLWLK
jgi:hypothetical protein